MLQKPSAETQRLLKHAAFLDDLEPDRFSMGTWGSYYEPRCICGWFMHNEGLKDKQDWEEAARLMGIDRRSACHMFTRAGYDVTPQKAASVLREYAVTGAFKGW